MLDQLLDQVTSSPYLGIELDQEFDFNTQVDKQLSKINRSIGALKRVSPFIPQTTRKNLYNTIVLPHFDMCSVVWSCISNTNVIRLQRAQNRAMRIILDEEPRSHVLPMLNDLKFLSANQRFHMNTCVTMWKIVHGHAPAHLSSNFVQQSARPRETSTTRSMSKLDVYHEKAHLRSFTQRGAAAWNKLPHCIQKIYNVKSFKSELRLHIHKNIEPILS